MGRAMPKAIIAISLLAPALLFARSQVASASPPASGDLIVVAGTGTSGAETAGPALSSEVYFPEQMATDSSGDLYFVDSESNEVDKISASGSLSMVAGDGTSGAATPGPASASHLFFPNGVAVDAEGDVYIADTDNNEVEKVTPGGILSIVAGTGIPGGPTPGPATSSELWGPIAVAVDSSGNLYIDDYENNLIEKVTPGGTLSVFAGNGSTGAPTPGPAISSGLDGPEGVAVDAAGNVYVSDTFADQILKVMPGGNLSIIAGTGSSGHPTPGPATSSDLADPRDIYADSAGDIYIADSDNNEIEKVTSSGTLSIVAGTGTNGPPTAGPATASDLRFPWGVAVDTSGDVFIADAGNARIEEVGGPPTLPVFTADRPPAGSVGVPYSYTFAATGKPTPTFVVTAGILPSGLTLDATTGVLTGIPTAPGTFTVSASNSAGTTLGRPSPSPVRPCFRRETAMSPQEQTAASSRSAKPHSTDHWPASASTPRSLASPKPPTEAATGWLGPMAESSAWEMPSSSAPRRVTIWTGRSSGSLPHRTARGTTSSPPMAESSASATPCSRVRPVGSTSRPPLSPWPPPRRGTRWSARTAASSTSAPPTTALRPTVGSPNPSWGY